jgi:hypothetical protein
MTICPLKSTKMTKKRTAFFISKRLCPASDPERLLRIRIRQDHRKEIRPEPNPDPTGTEYGYKTYSTDLQSK